MKLYAVIDPVVKRVYGIGDTEMRAVDDASRYIKDDNPETLEFREITLEEAKRVANGDNRWHGT